MFFIGFIKKHRWKEEPGARRRHYKAALKNEVKGWAKATGLSALDPLQDKYKDKPKR